MTRYDANTQEFVINTPCESAQKYWIGGAAKVRYKSNIHVFSFISLISKLIDHFNIMVSACHAHSRFFTA